MEYSEQLDLGVSDSVRDDVRCSCDDQLARAWNTSRPADMRIFREAIGLIEDTRDDPCGGVWIVTGNDIADGFEIA